MQFRNLLLATALIFPLTCQAVPFWGAKASSPAETAPEQLQPGEFVWEGQLEPSGPIVVVVSLPEQRAYVYRNGVQIGVSTASTGKKGHRTPTGVFTILQKDKHHHSSTYNNAPMPYQERLTWDGVALHAGGLPGYPSSHGCIHLPTEFARQLFGITHTGMTVVVANETTALRDIVHPAALAPVDPVSGEEIREPDLGAAQDFRWQPELSPAGPVTMVMSAADGEALVYRNGVEIGRARLTIRDPGQPLGTHAFMAMESKDNGGNAPGLRWSTLGLPGHAAESNGGHDHDAIGRVALPNDFVRAFHALLEPGVTMLITDAPVLEQTTGVSLNVVNADPQPKG